MNNDSLQGIVQAAFTDAEVAVSGAQGKYEVRVITDAFNNMRQLQRQQAVYAPLNAYIASGEVHALTIKAMTKEEWRKASLFGV